MTCPCLSVPTLRAGSGCAGWRPAATEGTSGRHGGHHATRRASCKRPAPRTRRPDTGAAPAGLMRHLMPVTATSDSADGPVVPDAGGHGQHPLGDPGVEALGGPAAVPLQVELALRVSLTDSIHCRIQPMDPCRGASPRRSGRTRCRPDPVVTRASNSRPAKPLSPTRVSRGRSGALDRVPEAGPLAAHAAEVFVGEPSTARVSSVHAIRARFHVGQPRTQRVRAYLAALIGA